MINNYVYWIENRGTNVSYVGVRSCDIEPVDDIGVKYFTSSQDKEFKQDFKANPSKYNIDIINNFIERQEAMDLEIQIHNWNNVDANDKFYNRAKATSNGFGITGMTGNKHPNYGKHPSKETLKKMSIANLGKKLTQEHKDKLSKAHKGKISPMRGKKHTKEARKKLSKAHTGKKHSEKHIAARAESNRGRRNTPETILKMRASAKGRVISPEQRKQISMTLTGVKHTQEQNRKQSLRMKGVPLTPEHQKAMIEGKIGLKYAEVVCPHCSKEGGINAMKRYHFDNCKYRE